MNKNKRLPFFGGLAICFIVGLTILMLAWNDLASAGRYSLPWNAPPNFRVVYLATNNGLTKTRAKAPMLLKDALGAETVNTWRQVLGADQARQIDALVIDKSALSQVNKQELKTLFGRGIVITMFDVPASNVASLLEEPCLTEDNFGTEAYSGSSFFVSVSRLIQGTPEDIARIRSTKPCGGFVEGVTSPGAGVTLTKQTDNLLTDNDYNAFAQVLTAQMQTMRNAKSR
jgi:hypothetical protein